MKKVSSLEEQENQIPYAVLFDQSSTRIRDKVWQKALEALQIL